MPVAEKENGTARVPTFRSDKLSSRCRLFRYRIGGRRASAKIAGGVLMLTAGLPVFSGVKAVIQSIGGSGKINAFHAAGGGALPLRRNIGLDIGDFHQQYRTRRGR